MSEQEQEQNDRKLGLYQKYSIQKADGSPLDPEARYFVVRYDKKSYDAQAAIAALEAYAQRIALTSPQLAADLRQIVKEARPMNRTFPENVTPTEWTLLQQIRRMIRSQMLDRPLESVEFTWYIMPTFEPAPDPAVLGSKEAFLRVYWDQLEADYPQLADTAKMLHSEMLLRTTNKCHCGEQLSADGKCSICRQWPADCSCHS